MKRKIGSLWRIETSGLTPREILEEQVAHLKFLTEGKLIGRVDEYHNSDGTTYLTLYITPAIDGAESYKIIHATHEDHLYPIDVESSYKRSRPFHESCENEEALVQMLHKILTSEKVVNLLSSLMAQIRTQYNDERAVGLGNR